MRVRLIQKILAVVIAAATTLITPGLVSAGGPNSDKNNSGGNSKTNSSQNASSEDALKKNNIFTILPTRKENSGEIEKKDQIQPAFIDPLNYDILKMNDMLYKAFLSDVEKRYFVQTVENFSKYHFFRDWTKKHADNILHTLSQCLTIEDIQMDVANIVVNLFNAGCFKGLPGGKIAGLSKVAFKFSNSVGSKMVISMVIEKLARLGYFKGLNESDMSVILSILDQCCFVDGAKKNVTGSILSLVGSGCLKNCSSNLIFNVTSQLCRCSFVMQTEMDVAIINKYLASEGYFKDYAPNQVQVVLNMLNNCTSSDFAKQEVANTIKYLADFKNFQNWSPKLVDILDKCSSGAFIIDDAGASAKKHAVCAISRLATWDCFKDWAEGDIAKIMDILLRCSYSDSVKCDVENVIKYLKEKGYLQHWLKNNIAAKNIVKLFKDFESSEEGGNLSKVNSSNEQVNCNNNMKIDLAPKKKFDGEKINFLSKKTKRDDEIKIDLSDQKAESDNRKIESDIENLFKNLRSKKDKNVNFPESEISKIIDMLFKYCKYDNSKKYIANVVKCLLNNHLLRNSSRSIILRIVDILNQCADDIDAKKLVAIDVFELVKRDLLIKCSNADSKNLNQILQKCLDGDDAKILVAKAIGALAEKGLLI